MNTNTQAKLGRALTRFGICWTLTVNGKIYYFRHKREAEVAAARITGNVVPVQS